LAGLFGAVVPLHYWVDCVNGFENSQTGLFLEVATLWLVRLLGGAPPRGRAGVAAGLLWGFGLLLAPPVAPVFAAFLALIVARRCWTARWAVALAATVVALLLPWTIRNWIQLGGPVFVRDDFGLELSVSNRDGAGAFAQENPAGTEAHPFTSVAVAREVQRMGELAFERRCLAEALTWIRAHPGEFARLTAQRLELFWLPAAPRFRCAMASVSLLAAFGLLLLWRRRRTATVILTALLASYSAFFYLIQNTLRYQHPIWWALLLLAAWPLASLGYTKRLRFSPNAIEHPVPSRSLP
jgi:hypothetical protein